LGQPNVYFKARLATTVVVLTAACMPASWGAGALLHPFRRSVTIARPAGAQDLVFENDGLQLKGWRFRGTGPRRGTVVYLHGSADNRASGVSIAERFLARGFDVLEYDSRAHGESQGNACTYGYYEKRDLSRAIDLIDVRPVVAFGVSLGAAVALQTAAEDPRIRAVVAVSTFSDLRTVASERAPFMASKSDIEAAFRLAEEQGRFKVDEVSPVLAAQRIHVPVLLVHGDADHETPAAHSQRVFAALSGDKRLLLVPGAGHDDVLRPDVWATIDAWVDAAAVNRQ
jgi:pimeloyl-ACP methyl ester carboxylesterase